MKLFAPSLSTLDILPCGLNTTGTHVIFKYGTNGQVVEKDGGKMELKKLEDDLTVCKVASIEDIDLNDGLFFIGKTDEEIL